MSVDYRRPGGLVGPPPSQGNSLADILERVLDKGIVIAGDIQINLLDIELLTIKLRLIVASIDKAKEMGIDWWETDPALNARTGHVDWTYDAGGRISGSATIIGRTVYFADLGNRRTYGLGISTGRKQFEWRSGSFDPVISDGQNIYLPGYSGLYALAPR